MCSGALVRTANRGTMSCQYALIILRWIHRAPEDFLTGQVVDVGDVRLPDVGDVRLPDVGPAERLRWDLNRLHAALQEHRRARRLTWVALATEMHCTPGRLTNLRTAHLADMNLAMCVTQRLARPAADFVHTTRW